MTVLFQGCRLPSRSVVLLLIGIALILLAGCSSKPALPDLGQAPDFTLTDQLGRQVAMRDLRGKVLLVNFVYTNCPETCPLQVAHMAQLQRKFIDPGSLRRIFS